MKEEPSLATLRRHPVWHPHGAPFGLGLGVLLLAVLATLVLALVPIAHDRSLAAQSAVCGVRILLVPVVIGIGDELQRAFAAAGHGTAVHLVFAPLVALERLVAVSPDDAQITLAATALLELKGLHADSAGSRTRRESPARQRAR